MLINFSFRETKRITLSMTIVVMSCSLLYGQSVGPNNGSIFGDVNLNGVTWASPSNAEIQDGVYTQVGPISDSADYLKVTGFGLTVPTDATINGVQVSIYKNSDKAAKTKDYKVMIVKDGVIGGVSKTNKALTSTWQSQGVPTWVDYGGSTDLWGETLTPKIVNDNSFGVAIAAQKNGAGPSPTASIDNIQITVFYSTTPLPIELVSFSAALSGQSKVELKWTTASEKNNDFFTVERSQNGLTFDEVAKVNGAGNSSTTLNYYAYDRHPLEGNTYYRLKQTDYDGRYTYSGWVTVNYQQSSDGSGCILKVYPNPCAGRCTVDLSDCQGNNGSTIKVYLVDALGNIVLSKIPYRDDNGNFNFSIDTQNNLKPGVYIVNGVSGSENYSKKVIIK